MERAFGIGLSRTSLIPHSEKDLTRALDFAGIPLLSAPGFNLEVQVNVYEMGPRRGFFRALRTTPPALRRHTADGESQCSRPR